MIELVPFVLLDSTEHQILTLGGLIDWRKLVEGNHIRSKYEPQYIESLGYCKLCFDRGGCHQPHKAFGCHWRKYDKYSRARMATIGEISVIYEMLKNSDGVVPVESLLDLFEGGNQQAERSKVTNENVFVTAAFMRIRFPYFF
jgi:hypothetical protein